MMRRHMPVAVPAIMLLALASRGVAQVSVTPDGGSSSAYANTTGNTVSFWVVNDGDDDWFSFSCTRSGQVSSCSAPGSTFISGGGGSASVSVTFDAGAGGTGTVMLAAANTWGQWDDGWYDILVISYGVTVTPDGATSATRPANTGGHSESFTVTNTGTVSNTFSFSCSGANGVTCGTVPGPVTLTPNGDAGYQTTVSMPYSVGSPGTGTLTLTANGTNASDPGSYSVPIATFAVAVTPDGATAATRTANTGGHSESFTVANTGSISNTYSFSCTGANGVTCGTPPGSVTLGAGAQTSVSMPYSVGAPGTGTLTLTASGSYTSDNGSYSVPIVSYGVAVTPDGQTSATRTANTGGHSETFTVQNTGSASNTYSFSCSGAGGVTCGTAPGNVTLGAGAQTTVSMPYSVGAPGTGTLTLTASGTNASDPGSYSVPIVSYGVAVTPDGATSATRPANTGGHSESFTVQNTGSASNTFSFSCSGANGVTCGTPPGNVTLASGAQTSVSMPYSVGAQGTGTLTLTASGTGASDNGSYSVPIATFAVSVAPDGATSATRTANTGGHSESFTVANTGSISNTYSFSCTGANGVTCGTPPGNVTLGAGAQTSVSMPYSVGAPGTGTLTLTASGSYTSDNGSYSVPIVSYGVAVTPDGATSATRTANTGGHSETFTVQNTGSASNTYSFSCSGAGGVTCGTAPGNVTLGAGAQTTVSMPYSVGAPGTGTLTLTASGTNASDPGSYSVPIVSYGVAVTPDGATTASRAPNSSGYSESFTVQNTGSASNTYSFACSASGAVTCGTAPGNVTLGAGAQTTVSMPYSTGDAGTGTLTFTATGTNTSDPGSYTIPIALSGVAGTAFTKDSRYLLQETALWYDATGRIDSLSDARSKVTKYQYGGNPNNAFLTKVTRRFDATGTVDLVTDIAYDSDGFVSSIKDEGSSFRYFTYDLYGRLREIKNHSQTVVRAYGYTYSRTLANGWVFQPASPNAVVDTTVLVASPVARVVSTEFLDGLGRPRQTVVQDGSLYVVTATEYDAMGRLWRTWKPYTRTSAGYDASFSSNATSAYNTYHSVSNAKPYTETLYTTDALARVRRVNAEYLGTSPTDSVKYVYGVDVTPKQTYTEITDEVGKKTRNHFDVFTNQVKTILGYGAAEATTTNLTYNVLGQRIQATDPRGLNTTYTLDTRGLLTAKASPDAGTVQSKYDQAGNLRYSQDANQAAAGQVFFTTFDFANRPLVSGKAAATFSSLDPFSSASFESTTGNWLVVRKYDAKPTTGPSDFPWNLFTTDITNDTVANVSGRLAAVASKSNDSWQATLFSYDTDGRVTKRHIHTHANGTTTVLAALNTRMLDSLNLQGAPTKRALTVGSNNWNQWYDYNGRGLLWKVSASTTASKPGTADVTYTYRPSGQVASRQFIGGPSVPFRYSIRERLDRIGSPASTSYPFSARYTYHQNGTVSVAEFYSGGSPATYKRYRYVFGTASYDALNRLKSADFSHYNSGWVSTLNYDLAGINYDASGNITALQRYRETGTLIDNLTKTIASTSNRLTSVTDAVSSSETWDAETGSFTYDANGNMLTAPAPYSITTVTYDHQNLPLSLTRSGTTTTYRYTEAGQRIAKQVGSGNREMYVQDGALSLGVFTFNSSNTLLSWYWTVVAGEKVVGRQPSSGDRRFYHTDLLGSTRAVTDSTVILESYDFDPWGVLMPGRTLGSGTKEGFTGKERDPETGLDYFGARYYMPAVGRLSSRDRFADEYPSLSVFAYAAGDPVALVDVNGDSINVSAIRTYDAANKTSHLTGLTSELEKITGLSLSVTEDGQLVYKVDAKGNAVIATDASGKHLGSVTAREMLKGGISASENLFVAVVTDRGSVGGGDQLGLNPAQIESMVTGVQGGLNPITMGMGMTFLHEFLHTSVGGNLRDPSGPPVLGTTGPVVDRMNTVRSELGSSFGQRLSYAGWRLRPGGPAYLPFDRSSLLRLQRGLAPRSGSMFIRY
jgi:RHS repeat-associated protein